MEGDKKVLTILEFSNELRVSPNLIYRQVRSGKIYAIKIGDRYLIPMKTLEQLLSGGQKEK